MEDRPIIVLTDSSLFEIGVQLGLGAMLGGIMAIALSESFSKLWGAIFGKRD